MFLEDTIMDMFVSEAVRWVREETYLRAEAPSSFSPVACVHMCAVYILCALSYTPLTVFHIVNGGEMLKPATHHATLPPQLGALSGRWRGAGSFLRARCALLGQSGLSSLAQLNAILNEATHQLSLGGERGWYEAKSSNC